MTVQEIELGDLVKDTVTGYTGVAVARTEWLNGCIRYVVQAQTLNKRGEPARGETFDESQLQVVSKGAVLSPFVHATGETTPPAPRPGGPRPDPEPMPATTR